MTETRKLHVYNGLTASQLQIDILKLLCQGKSNKEIGSDLKMSEDAVRNHIYRLIHHRTCKQFGVTTREKLILFLYPWSRRNADANNNVMPING